VGCNTPSAARVYLGRFLVTHVDNNTLAARSQDAFLQGHRRMGMIPQRRQIAPRASRRSRPRRLRS